MLRCLLCLLCFCLRCLLLLCSKVSTADEVAAAVVGMLDELGIQRACVMAHSYGGCRHHHWHALLALIPDSWDAHFPVD
jgi:hypothetical protein